MTTAERFVESDASGFRFVRPTHAESRFVENLLSEAASKRRDGEKWQSGNRWYQRTGGKTVRVAAPAKAEPAKGKAEPAKAAPTAPAKAARPDAASVHAELKQAFAAPDKLTPESLKALGEKLRGLTVPELQKIQKERGLKLTGKKLERVQRILDDGKAKVAAAQAEPAPAKNLPAGAAGVKAMAQAETDPAARDYLDSAIHNHDGTPADLARQLGASVETAHVDPATNKVVTRAVPPAAQAAARKALAHLGAEPVGPGAGETVGHRADHYQPTDGVGPNDPVTVAEPPLVLGGKVVAKGVVTPAKSPAAPATAAPTAPAPHAQARAAADAYGIAHAHLSDDEVAARMKAALKAAFGEAPAPAPKTKKAAAAKSPKAKAEPAKAPAAPAKATVVTGKDGERTTQFPAGEPEKQAKRLGPAVVTAMKELKLDVEHQDGVIPLGAIAAEVKAAVPDATDADVLAAVSHMRKTRQLEGQPLNEVGKLDDPKSGVKPLGGGTDPDAATLWDNGRAVHYFMLPKGK